MGGYRGIDGYAVWDKDSAQTVTVGAASAATTNVIGKDVVTVIATANCWVTYGTTPVATATTAESIYIPSGQYVTIPGLKPDSDKIAVIQDSTGGSLYVYPRIA